MIVVRLDRRPRATRSDSESLRCSRPWQMSMVQRVETAWTAAATRVHDGRQDRRDHEPLAGCAAGSAAQPRVLPPKKDLDQPQAALLRREAGVARRAEFHHRRQARQDKHGRQQQEQQAADDRAQASIPFASCPQAALQRQGTDGQSSRTR